MAICGALPGSVNSAYSSDPGGLRGDNPWPPWRSQNRGMRVQAETPEPPAREPTAMLEFAPVTGKDDLVGKERYTERFSVFGVRPIPASNRAIFLCGFEK